MLDSSHLMLTLSGPEGFLLWTLPKIFITGFLCSHYQGTSQLPWIHHFRCSHRGVKGRCLLAHTRAVLHFPRLTWDPEASGPLHPHPAGLEQAWKCGLLLLNTLPINQHLPHTCS